MSVVASELYLAETPDGERFELKVEIGAPEQSAEHEDMWRCSLSLVPLFNRVLPVAGDGSLQALCLTVRLAQTLLEDFVEKGGRLSYPDGGSVDLHATFGATKK